MQPEQKTNIVFNYSSLKLTDAMQALLNRALNFALLPLKLDITQILVDFNRFARAAIWQEFWFNREKVNHYLYQYLNNGKVISQKIIPLQQD